MNFLWGLLFGLLGGTAFSFWILENRIKQISKTVYFLEKDYERLLARWKVLNARYDAGIKASQWRIEEDL
jgi:hypothetical protein